MDLDTGRLSQKEINLVLNSLPLDITLVDASDQVKYFNRFEERFFKRPKSVIGKEVQNCHPKKSLAAVEEILNDFKSKKRDSASFWLHLKDRFIYIRYCPIYDDSGNYLGCLEASQDITDISKLEGEKRLL
ncbi:MAG: PAS domain-containing protein [Actinomycetia bacterium]|nr:PAS domain-containing protein [Actinomycetes bacterium]